ncbi:tRNA lysidine(34) synthetase TilS [Altibacter sp.]|uniref:tRNA lysidine(34) synthetase TilS n=1 Tax=Altibacter sp. TaxID=2024823 RepID=UPI000C945ADD|nr:tRNA lysidine(34) synthetase TilS [Altibacter sp.]MAP54627.1 tRNA lysidine(34) synthetase TilS [Altibacter sp.]
MLVKLKDHIKNNLSFLNGRKLLVACSGGLDSVALARAMHMLTFEIGLAHCNFSLRAKESDEDEVFVIDLAERLSVPVYTETFDTKAYASATKLSTQMAARELRYRWFEELLKDFQYDYILTAHHADDDLETFFINLSRGTGLRGLTGIPAQNERVVRPLLPFSRQEIMDFAKREKWYWREDSSNLNTEYLRNKLRLDVLPMYKVLAPQVLQNFKTTQEHLQSSRDLIEDYMALIYNLAISEMDGGYKIDTKKLEELPHTDALLYELLAPFGFTSWDDISNLVSAQSGKQIFSGSHRLLKDRDVFLLTEIPSEEDRTEIFISENEKKIDHPIPLQINSTEKIGNTTPSTIYVDRDKIQFPLQLRKWQKGDAFQPFGMQGKKKLSKFFKDEKLSLVAKENIWLLCSKDQIIWIVGMRMDDRFKATEKTEHILEITTTP